MNNTKIKNCSTPAGRGRKKVKQVRFNQPLFHCRITISFMREINEKRMEVANKYS